MTIDWQRARSIFGCPKPPTSVWERQFDDFDDELQNLATTPYEAIDFGDLWYYHHDLAYVELQPDLFAYLFPVCLMDWHMTLQSNESCSHGDSEFHYGLLHGKVLEKMATPAQRQQIAEFFCDSLLERLDLERGLYFSGSGASAYGWMSRFNSLGIVTPIIPNIWKAWWSLETVGRAVAAVQYLSGLMYFDGENPVFERWTPDKGGGGPYLWGNDSLIRDTGWMPENADFLASVLTLEFVEEQLKRAAIRLNGQPECDTARQLVDDIEDRRELVESRTAELPSLLRERSTPDGWSV